MDLRDVVVVVTGASSGIGWEAALEFARHGATLVVSARREERLQDLTKRIEKDGGRALAVRCDVSDRDSVESLQKAVQDAFGRCDVLINNAGVPGGGTFDRMSIEQIERVVRVNYLGVLYCTKAFLPMMLDVRRGHIVNVASLAGRFAVPGSAVYSSTKHAVVAFSEALHFEVAAKGVLVTTVNPGFVETEGFPQREVRDAGAARFVMQPERIARAILDVVRTGKAPELSVPRWIASLQAFRVLTPPVYRFAMRRLAGRGLTTRPARNE